jgi:hypothetical protein
MANKHERKIKRVKHRGHTKLLGGKHQADKLRRDAADLRTHHDLCLCRDEEKHYLNEEEASADKSPPVVCGDCGKPKLRVGVIVNKTLSDNEQLYIRDLLRSGVKNG